MRRLRICVLGSVTSPHVVARAAVFQDFGHDVTLISPVPGVAPMPVLTVERRPGLWGKITWICGLLRLVAASRADVYHAHYAAEIVAWAAWLCRKRPLVISVMGGDVLFAEQGSLGPLSRWLVRQTLRAADLVTVKSQRLREVVADFGVPRNRIMEIVWGVEGNMFRPRDEAGRALRRQWGVPDGVKLLYSPRMLQPLYNQDVLIQALAAVPDAWLALSCFRADPVWEARCRDLAARQGVQDRIVWVAGVPREEMAVAYSAADMIVSLPSSDGFPQSVLEAMACQRVVLMSDLPVYQEYFTHGESAWFTPIDPHSVAQAILKLFGDCGRMDSIVRQAAAIVAARCDFASQARTVETALFQLAGHRDTD